jgi:serine/threonine protein phosphatase 1
MKTYAIADLHGRADLLMQVFMWLSKQEPGKLVVTGDMVDRGADSRGVLDALMVLQRTAAAGGMPGWEVVVLRGNHEEMMLEVLAKGQTNPALLRWWIGNGGGATLLSYGHADFGPFTPEVVDFEHVEWLMGLPVWHEDEHRIFVHAGVPHDKRPEDTPPETLQWMLYRGGEAEEILAKGGKLMSDSFDSHPHVSGKHIVHGHEQSATHPLRLEHRTNLDAFAWRTGKLAVGVFEGPGGLQDVVWFEGEPG